MGRMHGDEEIDACLLFPRQTVTDGQWPMALELLVPCGEKEGGQIGDSLVRWREVSWVAESISERSTYPGKKREMGLEVAEVAIHVGSGPWRPSLMFRMVRRFRTLSVGAQGHATARKRAVLSGLEDFPDEEDDPLSC